MNEEEVLRLIHNEQSLFHRKMLTEFSIINFRLVVLSLGLLFILSVLGFRMWGPEFYSVNILFLAGFSLVLAVGYYSTSQMLMFNKQLKELAQEEEEEIAEWAEGVEEELGEE